MRTICTYLILVNFILMLAACGGGSGSASAGVAKSSSNSSSSSTSSSNSSASSNSSSSSSSNSSSSSGSTPVGTLLSQNPDEPDSDFALRINSAITQLSPGDTLRIADGLYSDMHIIVPDSVRGTSDNRITIKADKPGEVVFKGDSYLQIGGHYVTVEGFYYFNGETIDSPVVTFIDNRSRRAKYSTISDFAIHAVDAKQNDGNKAAPYVYIAGVGNRVQHSAFYGKSTIDAVIKVGAPGGTAAAIEAQGDHIIERNWVSYTVDTDRNGLECFRVNPNNFPTIKLNVHLRDNLFEQCDADDETVSIKAAGIIVEDNTFLNSRGDVNIRSRNDSTMRRNIILADDDNNVGGIGGLRASGANHVISENYVIASRRPFRLIQGGETAKYQRVTNITVENNTFFNPVYLDFSRSFNGGTERPEGVRFANNLFIRKAPSSNDPFIILNFDVVTSAEGNVAVNTNNGGWDQVTAMNSATLKTPEGLVYPSDPALEGKGAPAASLTLRTRGNTGPGTWYVRPNTFAN